MINIIQIGSDIFISFNNTSLRRALKCMLEIKCIVLSNIDRNRSIIKDMQNHMIDGAYFNGHALNGFLSNNSNERIKIINDMLCFMNFPLIIKNENGITLERYDWDNDSHDISEVYQVISNNDYVEIKVEKE